MEKNVYIISECSSTSLRIKGENNESATLIGKETLYDWMQEVSKLNENEGCEAIFRIGK